MVEDIYEWTNFYKEFANVLKKYEGNPNLLNIFKNIITEVNMELPKNSQLAELNTDYIDPFAIYALFNKDINKKTRLSILRKIKERFLIESEIPSSFVGIPTFKPIQIFDYLNNVTEDSTNKIWTLFKLALDYADGKTVKLDLIKAYDETMKIYGIKWNLSIFLYLIRPETFINLDSTNRGFLKKKCYIEKDIVLKIESLKEPPIGELYLEICEECREKLLNNCVYNFETFPELSHVAWTQSFPKKRFHDFLKCNDLVFDKELIENLLLSLKVKPFVILTGNSGTGKTKLAQEIANYCISEKLILPIGSNWTDNRNIFGYYNPILSDYIKTTSLEFIESSNESSQPHFLILDEMNLSHVERYFADYLSAIESGNPIPLANYESGEISIPDNLFTIGTVNVDETTYMFSPKVLDRANTIEFKTMNPEDYLENKNSFEFEGDTNFLLNLLDGIDVREKKPNDFREEFKTIIVNDNNLWDTLVNRINELYKILFKSNFDFGFRVINEVFRYMYVARRYENKKENFDNWGRYFDAQILQKILPRIHGSSSELLPTLEKLEDYCQNNNFCKSEEKISEMINVLKNQKFVSFIN